MIMSDGFIDCDCGTTDDGGVFSCNVWQHSNMQSNSSACCQER